MISGDNQHFTTRLVLLFASLALIGAVLVLVTTSRFGAGISPNSISFISAARNLNAGEGFTISSGAPVTAWPPLYPALLAFVGRIFNGDSLQIADALNAFIFALIIYSGGALSFKYLSSSPIIAVLGVLLILASIPVFSASVMVWSEPLFILLVLLGIICSRYYLQVNDSISLMLLSLSVSLACMTRYIGVVLILWGILVILFQRGGNVRKRLNHAIIFTLISILPLTIWITRNYVLSGTLFGLRAASINSLDKNLSYVFNTFLEWYVPGKIVDHRAVLILTGITFGFLAGMSLKGAGGTNKIMRLFKDPMVLFTIMYLTALVILSTVSAADGIGDRLLSPAYVPLTLLLLVAFNTFVKGISERHQGRYVPVIANATLIIGILLWLVYPLDSNILAEAKRLSNGVGYNTELWRNSELMQYLIQHQDAVTQYTIYTNHPDAVDILAGLVTKVSPIKRASTLVRR